MNNSERALREKSSYSNALFVKLLDAATISKSILFESRYTDFYANKQISKLLSALVTSEKESVRVLEIGTSWFINWLPFHKKSLGSCDLDVTAINISPDEIAAHKRILASSPFFSVYPSALVEMQCMDAENITFPRETRFDLVIGGAILHHIDYDKSLNSLRPFLSKDAVLIFREPLGSNPAINLYRFLTPFLHTEDEEAINISQFKRSVTNLGFQIDVIYQEALAIPFFPLLLVLKVLRIKSMLRGLAYIDSKVSNTKYGRFFARISTLVLSV